MRRWRSWQPGLVAPAALLFLLSLALNRVLLLPGERIYRGSIEAGYASMARFVAEHPNPWGWKPEQYCGLPAQHAYLPVIPYATAAAIWLFPGIEPPQVYRLVTVLIACLGPVTVFLFVSYFTRSRWWALATALTHTFFSPIYILVQRLSLDAGIAQLPARLHNQIKYGDAPHNAGLTLLPLALIALHTAAKEGRRRHLIAASVLLAAVALTNWIAALALAWCGLMLILSGTGSHSLVRFHPGRVLFAGLLAGLLAAFWLTPSLLGHVASNWPKDAFGYQLLSQQRLALAALALAAVLLHLVLRRWNAGAYLTFLVLSAFGFAYVVLGLYWFGVETIPESRRYVPEADLFLTLLYFELARRALSSRRRALQEAVLAVALLAAILGVRQVWRYATKPPLELTPVPKEQTAEYRVARFLADQQPRGRVFVTGGTRFHLNSWFSLPQTGGTFESSVPNRAPIDLAYQITSGEGTPPGEEGSTAVMQLKAMAVEYVAVHGPDSKEFYRDFRNPRKFDGLLERVYDRDGDTVFRLPFTSYAHLVRRHELPPVLPTGKNVTALAPYVAAIEDATRPKLRTTWSGPSELILEGMVPPDMLISVQVSYHDGWKALQDAHPVPIERDAMGFLLLSPRAGHARITLRFHPTVEQRILAAVSALTWLVLLLGAAAARRNPRASPSTAGLR